MAVQSHGHRLLARLAQPRRGLFGLPRRGPAAAARLRPRRARRSCAQRQPWPTVDAIAITHFHLDHWGDLVPWVWGGLFGPGESLPKPKLWLPPGASEQLRPVLAVLGSEDMFDRAFEVSEYEARVPFTAAAGLEVTAAPGRPLRRPGLRLPRQGRRASSPTRATAGRPTRSRSSRATPTCFLSEATLENGGYDGACAATSRPRR